MAALWAVPSSQRSSVTHRVERWLQILPSAFVTHTEELRDIRHSSKATFRQVKILWNDCLLLLLLFEETRVGIVQGCDVQQVWCQLKNCHSKESTTYLEKLQER